MNTYTFYWMTGDRETQEGMSAEDALMRAGYSAGALRALDFYASGDNHEYQWDAQARKWRKQETTGDQPAANQ